MEVEKLKLYLDFAKFFLGSVVVALITFWVNSGFKDREVAIKEQEYLAQFKDDALNEDIETRRRLAEYFSKVTLSEEARIRWNTYLSLLTEKQEEQANNEARIQELEHLLKDTREDSKKSEELKQSLQIEIEKSEKLQRELSAAFSLKAAIIGEKGWVYSRFIDCQGPIASGAICKVTPSRLSFRELPNIRSEKLGVLMNGQSVQVMELKQNNWAKVIVTKE